MKKPSTYNIRSRILFVAMMLLFCLHASAEESRHTNAEKLNQQVELLMKNLYSTNDTSTYYNILQQVVKTVLQCDYYDGMPNEKGKVVPKFRHMNSRRLQPMRTKLIDAGMYYYSHGRNNEAISVLKTYIDLSKSHLFREKKDLYKGQAAYYLALLSYGIKDFTTADYYADLALRDAEYASDAAEIKVSCMKETMVTTHDSTRYLLALLELHDKAPHNMTYFRQLLEYFSLPGHEREMEQFAMDETRKNPTSKHAWALLGETKMSQKDWSGAEEAYQIAISLDSIFIEAIYNKGICESAQAKRMVLNEDSANICLSDSAKKMFLKAVEDFEKAKRLDPQRKEVDWCMPLFFVYNILGDKEKAKAISPLIDESKQKKS